MGTSIGSPSDAVVAVVLIAMFAIVLVVAHRVLKEMPLFGDGGSWVVAFCTAALSVLGLVRFLGPQEHGARADSRPAAPDGMIHFILLPYAALAISILFVLLLLALAKRWTRDHATLWDQRQAEPAPRTKTLTRKRQPAPRRSLRTRLKK